MQAIRAGLLIVDVDDVREQSGLLIENGEVKAILPNEAIEGKIKSGEAVELQDARDSLVMPGFVNAHMHQYGMLSHGLAADVENFESFLDDYWWPYIENRIGRKEVEATTKASAAEMIHAGITTYCDTMEAPFSGEDILLYQAGIVEQIGLRAILSLESCERVDEENGLHCLNENRKMIEYQANNGGRVGGMMCTHTSFTCSAPFMQKAKQMADELGAMWQFHLSESIFEPTYAKEHFGKLPVVYYDELGLLSGRVLASQCVQMQEEEIEILAKRGVQAVHMPMSNCEVGGGFAPVEKMLAAGVDVALGTDGYINDFFEVMRGAFLMHKANQQDPSAMPAKTVFQMATENGGKALGMPKAGTLRVGSFADITVMSRKFPTPLTSKNLFDQIVVFGQKQNVTDVYVAGTPILQNKQLATMDEAQVFADLRAVATSFWEVKRG